MPKGKDSVAGQIADTLLNTSRDRAKEFTYITRYQAILFPLLDTVIVGKNHIIAIAEYMEGKAQGLSEAKLKALYKKASEIPDLAEQLLYSTTQWNKSIGGAHIKRSFDLAETDLTNKDEPDLMGGFDYQDEEE